VLQTQVVNMTLIAHLRPAAYLRPVHFFVLHFFGGKRSPASEDEDARAVGIGDKHGVTTIFVYQSRERIQMRLLEDEQLMFFDWSVKLHGFKEIIFTGARENGDAVRRRARFFREVFFNALRVAPETFAFGRMRLEGLSARRKLVANETLILVASVLVCLRVKIKADNRQPARIKFDETLQQILQWLLSNSFSIRHNFSPSTLHLLPTLKVKFLCSCLSVRACVQSFLRLSGRCSSTCS